MFTTTTDHQQLSWGKVSIFRQTERQQISATTARIWLLKILILLPNNLQTGAAQPQIFHFWKKVSKQNSPAG